MREKAAYIVLSLARPGVHSQVKVTLNIHGAGKGDVARLCLLPALPSSEIVRVGPLYRILATTLVGVGSGAARAVVPCEVSARRHLCLYCVPTKLIIVPIVGAFAVGCV